MEVWTKVAEATNASMAAGELVAFIDGKHVSLGHKSGEHFTFTPAGQEVHERLNSEAIVAAAKADAGGGRKQRKPKVVVEEPTQEQVDEPAPLDTTTAIDNESEEDALDRELSLALGDEVGTEESAG